MAFDYIKEIKSNTVGIVFGIAFWLSLVVIFLIYLSNIIRISNSYFSGGIARQYFFRLIIMIIILGLTSLIYYQRFCKNKYDIRYVFALGLIIIAYEFYLFLAARLIYNIFLKTDWTYLFGSYVLALFLYLTWHIDFFHNYLSNIPSPRRK